MEFRINRKNVSKHDDQEKDKTSIIIGINDVHFGVYLNKLQTKKILDKAMNHGINFDDSAPVVNEN